MAKAGAAAGKFRPGFQQLGDAAQYFYQGSIQAKTATAQLTEAIIKHDVGLMQAVKSGKMFNSVLQEQYDLQKMLAVQWSKNANGTMTADVIVPRGADISVQKLTQSLKGNLTALKDSHAQMKAAAAGSVEAKAATESFNEAVNILRMRMGLANQVLASVGTNMVNWGKNTQWAGRQLTVGFTVPFAALAVGAGYAANQVDQQLTRIVKVYDFTATTTIGKEREMAALRAQSFSSGIAMAKAYGVALKDTLSVEADLAATGAQGVGLIKNTADVMRAATLGELDYNETVKATIALQSVYKMNADQITKAFNYMNSVENSTNLTMKDFVEAIPRAAGPLHQLGVSLQDMGVLLTAMKAGGISAEQGANALKSAVNRVINPTKAAVDLLSQYNINITEIVKNSGGNLMQILTILSDKMKDFSSLSKEQIIGKLFGTYQMARIGAIITGLQDVHDKTTQVGRAFDVGQQSAESWALTAENELNQVQNSLSGRFKRAIEGFKAQMAEAGRPFLQMASYVVKLATGMVHFFNMFPGWLKFLVMFGAAFVAVVGPMIMMIGLIGNLAGNAVKFAAALSGLTTKWRAMTTEQQATQLLAKQNTIMWQDQATAAKALAVEINKLTGSLERLAVQEAETMVVNGARVPSPNAIGINAFGNAPGVYGPTMPSGDMPYTLYGNPNGRAYYHSNKTGQVVTDKEVLAWQAAAKASMQVEQSSNVIAKTTQKVRANLAAFGMAGAVMLSMIPTTNKWVGALSDGLMVASLIGPTILKAFKNTAIYSAISSWASGLGASLTGKLGTSLGGKLLPMITQVGSRLAALAGPIAIAGAAAAFVIFKIHSALVNARREQEALDNSAKDWAKQLGFVYIEYAKITTKGAVAVVTTDTIAKKMEDANKPLAQQLQHYKDINDQQALLNLAIQQGLNVRAHGGSPEQALQAVEASLRIAGYNTNSAVYKNLMLRVKAQVDFSDIGSTVRQQAVQWANIFESAVNNKFGQGFWEGLWRGMSGQRGGMNTKAKQAIKDMANEFYGQWVQESQTGRTKFFDMFDKQVTQEEDRFFSNLGKNSIQKLKSVGINNYQQLAAAYAKNGPYNLSIVGAIGDNANSALGRQVEAEKRLTQAIAEQDPGLKRNAKNFQNLSDLKKKLDMATEAQVAADEKAANQARITADAIQAQGDATKYLITADMDAATASGYLSDGLKKAFSGAQDAVLNAANNIWSEMESNTTEGIQAAYQARTDAIDKQIKNADRSWTTRMSNFDNSWKKQTAAVKKGYDDRISALQKQSKAEQEADNLRQRIFQAEQNRLQRLSQLRNSNIDFNVALATGNLDEAAKVFNDMQSQQSTWANQDAQDAASAAAQKAQQALQDKIQQIQDERDARLQALQDVQDAQKAALEQEKQNQQDILNAQKDAIQKQEQAAEKSAQRELARKKTLLDMELETIKASTPRTVDEYNAQIKQIEDAYAKYGVDLQSYGQDWAGIIGNALSNNIQTAAADIQSTVDWKQMGKDIADSMTGGAFNMTAADFMKWVVTGQLPRNFTYAGGEAGDSGAITHNHRHAGGPVGPSGYNDRAGRPMNAPLYPDESSYVLQHGEWVLNRQAVKNLGSPMLNAINRGIPLSSLMIGTFANMVKGAMARGIFANGGIGFGATKPGDYAGTNLSAEQLANAAIIMSVGRAMGASTRDLIVAIMTAMQESGLRNINYGDRDSLGLFQQRPSQGWGSPSQIMNPSYASRKFFEGLLAVSNRNSMPLTLEAQAVQRSAYPFAYQQWMNLAEAVVSGQGFKIPGLSSGGTILRNNTIANLHEDEKVLTAPLSADLERGIRNFGNGGDTYKISIDLRGATIREDIDIEKAVTAAIDKKEQIRGRKRKIGPNE